MAGDQIYADMLNRHIPFGLADTEKEFRERYLTAFGAPNTRRLLRTIPQYMILDDHEIEDNWVQGRVKDSDKRTLFNLAISAYRSYQWSHCPRNHGQKLFYQFECAGTPFSYSTAERSVCGKTKTKSWKTTTSWASPRNLTTASGIKAKLISSASG